MESYEKLKSFSTNPLNNVSFIFSSSLDHKLLEEYLKFIKKSRNVNQLHENLKFATRKLFALDSFSECKIEVSPGYQVNTAEVKFLLKEKPFAVYNLEGDMDPTRFTCKYEFRGIAKRPSLSELRLGYLPDLKSIDGSFSYMDRISIIKDLSHGFQTGKTIKILDVNAHQSIYFGEIFLKTWDGNHKLDIGYHLRSNKIATTTASAELIKNCIIPTDKYFIAYTYTYTNETILNFPLYLKLRSELASSQSSFSKTHLSIGHKYNFISDLFLITKAKIGYLHTFDGKKPCINDMFRYHNVKGFKYLGNRQYDKDGSFDNVIVGDNLGSQKKLYFENILMKKSFPLFSHLRIIPYVFGSSAYIPENPSWRDNLRFAVGFGMKWRLPFGTLDISYTSRAWRQQGDVPAEFQVFFNR